MMSKFTYSMDIAQPPKPFPNTFDEQECYVIKHYIAQKARQLTREADSRKKARHVKKVLSGVKVLFAKQVRVTKKVLFIKKAVRKAMTEVRQRPARHKGQLNFGVELRQILYAYGDDKDPLDETIRVVDEMVTDYIIELSHKAQHVAEYSGRSKIKNDDFLFTIRKDELATGRVKELHMMEKRLKEDRKQFDTGEGKVGLERGGRKKKDDKAEDVKVSTKGKGKGVEEPLDDDEDLVDADDE